LDGELSLFERGILRRHLRRCASCAEYARTVKGFTELLRATPLEQIRLESIVLRSRRPVPRIVRSIAATAAVVAFGTWFGVTYSNSPRVSEDVSPTTSRNSAGTPVDNRGDWPAGLPHSRRLIQLVPGGLQTSGLTP
jgi:anti-sigma factor RsiW